MNTLPFRGNKIDFTSKNDMRNGVSIKIDYSNREKQINHLEKNEKQMGILVEGMNKFIDPLNVSLRFELHEQLQEYYVKVIDVATDEIIREIPSKKFLDMYAAMTEYMGLFVDKKV